MSSFDIFRANHTINLRESIRSSQEELRHFKNVKQKVLNEKTEKERQISVIDDLLEQYPFDIIAGDPGPGVSPEEIARARRDYSMLFSQRDPIVSHIEKVLIPMRRHADRRIDMLKERIEILETEKKTLSVLRRGNQKRRSRRKINYRKSRSRKRKITAYD